MTVLVVGAGMAGLVAARRLRDAGATVTVLDKGRSVGGRMATRRMGAARLDHGAQFFTARSDEFAAMVDEWIDAGIAHEWCRGFGNDDGHPRYVGTGGMTAIAKHLASGLDVRCAHLAFSLRHDDDAARWVLVTDDGVEHVADRVLLTAPIPQSMSLLFGAGIELPEGLRDIDYDRTIGLLVTLDDHGHAVAPPGGIQNPDEVFTFVGDNAAKGVSDAPSVTFHANNQWSLDNYERDNSSLTELLMTAAAPHLGGARVQEHQVKKWRFATPRTVWPDKCWVDTTGTLAMAGDAFAGPRVEGAALSGLAAATVLL